MLPKMVIGTHADFLHVIRGDFVHVSGIINVWELLSVINNIVGIVLVFVIIFGVVLTM